MKSVFSSDADQHPQAENRTLERQSACRVRSALGVLLCLATVSRTAAAQEPALIWSTRAYSVDQNDETVTTFRFLEEVQIETPQRGDFFRLISAKPRRERIHTTHVLKLFDLKYFNQDHADEFLAAVRELRRANKLAKEGKRFPSVLIHQRVLQTIEDTFDPLPSVYAWIMASMAYDMYFADDKELAFGTLNGADQLLEQLSAEDDLHAAEVRCLRGLLLREEKQPQQAIPLFKEAIRVATLRRGARSSDVAVYLQNLSLALEESGQLKQAIVERRRALEIEREIYPQSAAEIANDEAYVGYLLIEIGQDDDAIRSNERALTLYRKHHPENLNDIVRTQFNLALSHYNKSDFARAEKLFGNIDFTPSSSSSQDERQELKGLRKQTLNYQGTIAYENDRPQISLDYFLNASKLSDRENPESLDGDIRFNVAGRYQDLGRIKDAMKWYAEAAAIYKKVEGDDSDNVIETVTALQNLTTEMELNTREMSRAERLKELDSEHPVRKKDRASTNTNVGFANYGMNFQPHETMLITKTSASIMDGRDVIKTVPRGTQLWNLEQKDGWHRVVIPGTYRTAWVANAKVDNLRMLRAVEMVQEMSRRNANNPEGMRLLRELNQKIPIAMRPDPNRTPLQTQAVIEEVLELYGKVAKADDYVAATIRSRLSGVYIRNHQFVKSRSLIERSLPLQRQALGSDHPFVATELARLASLLVTIGDTAGARDCMEEALPIALRRFGETDTRITGLRVQLANVLMQNGQLEKSEATYRQILSAEEQGDQRVTLPLAVTHFGLGRIALARREFDDAIRHFNESLEAYSELGEGLASAQVEVLLFRSKAEGPHGQLQQARRSLARARQIVASNPENLSGWETQISSFEANVEAESGNWDTALKLVDEVLAVMSRFQDTESPMFRAGYAMRGKVLANLNRTTEAAAEFDHARQLAHDYIVNTMADQPVGRQVQFIDVNDAPHFHAALSLGLLAAQSPKIREQSATWLLNSKNIANELAARDGQVRKLLRSEAEVQNYEEWLDARKRLAVLPKLTPEEKADRQLDQTEANLKRTIDSTFRRLPAEARRQIQKRRSAWALCEDVRRRLQPDEVFIDFLRMRPRFDGKRATENRGSESYVAWIIPPVGRGEVSVINLGSAAKIDRDILKPLLAELNQSLVKRKLVGEEASANDVSKLARKVTEEIWQPISAQLARDIQKITLCPDSQLWKVPWAALPVAEDRFLVENFTIRFVSSGRDLLRDNEKLAGLSQPIIMADPAYAATADEIPVPQSEPVLRSFARKQPRFDIKVLRDALPRTIKRLSGTADEAHSIEPHLAEFSGMQSRVLLRTNASEAAFRSVNRPHTLFVGTHGFFFPKTKANRAAENDEFAGSDLGFLQEDALDNPLRRCGLLLAGCQDEQPMNVASGIDGILTGEEVIAQDLRGTELVVLSACETGIGDLNNGQGVAGLRQAIQLAGAKSVVSTLWSIEDQATSALIADFFRNLASGKTKSLALREAQLTRIKARRNRFGAAHPFYWAAFTVTGRD